MSRELGPSKDLKSATGQMVDVDVDAEHDPKVSRRASNVGLAREAVQMKAGGQGKERAHEAAARGVQSPSTALPHRDAIQRSFGAHDVSQVKAHVGDGSATAMGAEAYATGNDVVFDKNPDLHTAAHEAAHVVQQAQGVNLQGGVGKAGDAHEQTADAVADRVVQGKSAEDLLGTPTNASPPGGAIQQQPRTQADADTALIAAIQAHVKLSAARMYAASAKVVDALKMPTGGDAGTGPMLTRIAAEIAGVNDDLDNLNAEISRAPSLLQGVSLNVELGAIHGAFHAAWAPALGKVYGFTHDKDQKLLAFAEGTNLNVTATQKKMKSIFNAAGVDESTVTPVYAARVPEGTTDSEQREKDLTAAEMQALSDGVGSVQVSLDLIHADLHSSISDQSKEALDLTVSVEQLVSVLGPIDPSHIGKMVKLPAVIKQVEALQAEIMKMKDAGEDKGKALAPKIGTNTPLSVNLSRLHAKMREISTVQKAHKH